MSTEPSQGNLGPPNGAEHVEAQPPALFVGRIVNLRTLGSALFRNRWLWISTMALGLVVGLAVPLVQPGSATATTTLLLEHVGAPDQNAAMATDVALLQTEGVAQQVVTQLHLTETASALLTQYIGKAVTDQVLQITLSAPSAVDALREVNALTSVFLQHRSQVYKSENQVVTSALQSQLSGVANQVAQLNAAISSQPASGASALVSERDQDVAEESQIQQAIQTNALDTNSTVAASSLLAPGVGAHHSKVGRLAKDAVAGLLVGLVVGVGMVVLWELISDGVRKREDVALAIGAPVELNLGRYHRPRRAVVHKLRDQLERVRPDTLLMARHLRTKGRARKNLAVVSVDSIEISSLAVAYCAAELARANTRVLVVDLSDEHILSNLFGTLSTEFLVVQGQQTGQQRRNGAGPRGGHALHIGNGAAVQALVPIGDERTEGFPSVEFVLVLATLNPTTGAEALLPWAQEALMVVTAGRSNAAKLHANAEMLGLAGVRLDSAILIGADRDDYTLGRGRSSVLEERLAPMSISQQP